MKSDLYNILAHSNLASMSIYDTEVISRYIASYGQQKNITVPRNTNLRTILNEWSNNKQFLFNLLRGKLIYQFPVELPIDEETKINAMKNALKNSGAYALRQEFYSTFGKDSKYSELFDAILKAFNSKNLIKNIWDFGNFNIEEKNLKIFNGMKITTVFKKISDIFNLQYYENFRIAQSQGCNLAPEEGIMYLSIHPLDFFTLADNDCNWDTCLSWNKEGGNCLGTIELMNSKTAIVAYIKSKKDMKFSTVNWNSKKWRELFFISDNFIIEGKAYPYRQDELSLQIMNKLKELGRYGQQHIEIVNYSTNTDENVLNLNIKQKYMFNDFKYIAPDNFHAEKRGHYSYFSSDFDFSNLDIDLTSYTNCLWCGKEIDDNEVKGQSSNIFCKTCCQVQKRCSCCGKLCFDNSIMELEYNNKLYCENCMLSNCFIDIIDSKLWENSECMEINLYDELSIVSLKSIEILNIYSKYTHQREYNIRGYFKNIHKTNIDGKEIYYVFEKDLTPLGKQLFGIDF